jgi:hypothetical protein
MSKSASKIKNMASPPCYYKRVMARELLKRRHSITLAILIIIFSPIHICGPLSASANSYATSPRSPNETVCSDSTVVNKYTIAGLQDNVKPFINLIAPRGGEVWEEGKTYEIRWESQGIDAVYISVAVGGKDKGLLEQEGNSKIDAKKGMIAWNIPVGFITGFGIPRSDRVRIMVFDIQNSAISSVSDYFTIEGATTASPEEHGMPTQDEYRGAIMQYYEAIANKQYREAYEMLGQCKIVLYDADGSAVAFQPRDNYESWLKAQKNIDTLAIVEVKRYHRGGDPLQYSADKGDAEATVGIRTYLVTLDIKLREQNWAIKSGQNSLLVTVVKGIDDKIRIVGIGTGP